MNKHTLKDEKVYTRTGDKGTTGIHGGARVPKDDIRIEANGCLDELNAVIGIVRSMLPAEDNWQELLHTIQRELMVVMSHVATPDGVLNPNLLSAAELTVRCEQEMDAMTAGLKENGYFLLPVVRLFLRNYILPAQWQGVPSDAYGHCIAKLR